MVLHRAVAMVLETEFVGATVHEQGETVGARLNVGHVDPFGLRLPHDKGLAAMSLRDFQGVLVTMTVTIVVVGMVVVKPGQVEGLPALPFVEYELPALNGAEAPRVRNAEGRPRQA